MRVISTAAVVLVLGLTLGDATLARAQAPPPPPTPQASDDVSAEERVPPRLSYVDGHVSFWRPGAPEWTAAQVNTALAPGDELSTGSPGTLEVQIGDRAFVRAWAGTSLGLVNQDPDFLQLKVTAGHASVDLRALDPGRVVEIDTPNAAITVEHPGYYRVHVQGDRTALISRRAGRAIVTPANGRAVSIASSEEVVIEGVDAPQLASYAAPPLDAWDRWNYARTDYLGEAVSARYVSPGVYGVSDLDRHGRWRVVPDYGSVWVPTSVPSGWVPYSTGSWTWDSHYGWTWVDTAPWGWAPFHYGRWVFVDSYWAWAPGPVVVRPAYAPALVAFFGGGPSVRVGWVALGWGEPCIPWWGRSRFVGVPWWGGWGGPRVVNNVVINRTTVVNAQNVTVYRNAGVRNAVVAVEHQRFGRGSVSGARIAQGDAARLEPVRGRLDVQPVGASLAPTTVRGARPPDDRRARSVVATRAPQGRSEANGPEPAARGRAAEATPSQRLVPAPRQPNADVESPRPPFGRGQAERPQPPPPPRLGGAQPRDAGIAAPRNRPQTAPPEQARTSPRVETPRQPGPPAGVAHPQPSSRVDAPRPQAPKVEAPRPEPRKIEMPRPQASRTEPPRPQAAPRLEQPRPPSSPRMEAPRAQQGPRLEAPRAQPRPLPGVAADRMSPGRGDARPQGNPRPSNGGQGKKGRD
jgi:hypothetical protein